MDLDGVFCGCSSFDDFKRFASGGMGGPALCAGGPPGPALNGPVLPSFSNGKAPVPAWGCRGASVGWLTCVCGRYRVYGHTEHTHTRPEGSEKCVCVRYLSFLWLWSSQAYER